MVPHQMQKSLAVNKRSRTVDCVCISEGLRLFDKVQTANLCTGGCLISLHIARLYDYANLINAGSNRLFDNKLQRCFFLPIPIYQLLEWEAILIRSGSGNDRFLNRHRDVATLRNGMLMRSLYPLSMLIRELDCNNRNRVAFLCVEGEMHHLATVMRQMSTVNYQSGLCWRS